MKVYIVLKTVTYHIDGDSFDATIEGTYQSLSDAEKKRDLLESEFEKNLEEQKSEYDDDEDFDEDMAECDVKIIEQNIQ